MDAVIERCAGIDEGRKFIDVCVMVGEAQAEPTEQTRRFTQSVLSNCAKTAEGIVKFGPNPRPKRKYL